MGDEWDGPGCRRCYNVPLGSLTNKLYQAFKRHAELGYLALSTGLPNAILPGNIPAAEWDSWHTLIVTDELARVVSCCVPLVSRIFADTRRHTRVSSGG